MIVKVTDGETLKTFVRFTEKHYASEALYAPPIYSVFYRELSREVLEKGDYTAILAYGSDGEVKGRLLYTVDVSKHKKSCVGYFSNFECVDDPSCARELFGYMERDLSARGIKYAEGTFSPYDPDTRRGILVKGFDLPPMIFTSYNYPYYGGLLEQAGYAKAYDTFALRLDLEGERARMLHETASKVREKFDIRVDSLDMHRFDRDIADVAEILRAATNELNYQEAPGIAAISRAAKAMKLFLNPRLIKIARENGTDRPIGFCMCLPDFNQVFRKTGGRIRPMKFLREKGRITAARGMLQYIVPEYQGAGIITVIFDETYNSFKKEGITYFEGGTILEENKKSWGVLAKFGGEIVKIYRIYGKEI